MTEIKFTPKKIGLTNLLEKKDSLTLKSTKPTEIVTYAPPASAKDRIRIIFDDSGSMGTGKMKDARDGCIEFMRNCTKDQTACAIHLMSGQNYRSDSTHELAPSVWINALTTNLPALSLSIESIKATGSTPLFRTLNDAQHAEPYATRYIVFSDGCPDYGDPDTYKEKTILKAIEEKTPVDTVLIAERGPSPESNEYRLLKELADRTGGIFLVFDRSKVNFATAFKYLSPGLRLQLSDGNTRRLLEEGKL